MKTIMIMIVVVIMSCENSARTKSGFSMNLDTSVNASRKVNSKKATIVISEVRILVSRIKYVGASSDSTTFKSDPVVVTLDTNLTTTQVAKSDVPAGTYKKISFKIHKPGPNEFTDDSDFNDGNDTFSMVVRGTKDGVDFVFKASKTMKQDVTFEEDLVISDDGFNATLTMNSSNWFNDGKSELDPTDSADASAIEKQIKASFRAFKDKDKDGKED